MNNWINKLVKLVLDSSGGIISQHWSGEYYLSEAGWRRIEKNKSWSGDGELSPGGGSGMLEEGILDSKSEEQVLISDSVTG